MLTIVKAFLFSPAWLGMHSVEVAQQAMGMLGLKEARACLGWMHAGSL